MATALRLCIFERSGNSRIRAEMAAVSDVKICAECADWDAMQEALQAHEPDAAIIHLDKAEIEAGFPITQHVAELAPSCKIIGVCDDHAPDTIIAAMRTGCSQFVRMPIDREDLAQAIDRVRPTGTLGAGRSQKICLMGASGGAGTTTIACNLALELAAITGQRTALVDVNLEFSDVACHFDCTPKCGVVDICREGRELDQMLLNGALHHIDAGVSLLSKPAYPTETVHVDPAQVGLMMQLLAEMYPFVLCDLPRSFTPVTVATLGAADKVLLITQLAVPFLRNASRIYEHLLHLGAEEEHIEIVINRSNASYEMISAAEVAEHFGRPVFADVPNDYKRMTSMRDLGAALITEAPNSPARLGIAALAQKLCEGNNAQPAPQTSGAATSSGGGILSRFWSRKSRPKG